MSDNGLEINLELVNQKVQFRGISETNPDHPISFDYPPPVGDGQGFLGLEMLVMSFAGCVSTAIVFLLRRMGKNIKGYRMKAVGERREKPLSLEKIAAAITIESDDISEDNIKTVLEQAEKISPVWIALKGNVSVDIQHCIIKDDPSIKGI